MAGRSLWHLSVIVFVIALVAAVVNKQNVMLVSDPKKKRSCDNGYHIKVVFVMDIRDTWQSFAWEILSCATSPNTVHIHALLECDDPADASTFGHVSDNILRARMRIDVCRRRDKVHPVSHMRRITRRAVHGAETIVWVVQFPTRSPFVSGWAPLVFGLLSSDDGHHTVILCPS